MCASFSENIWEESNVQGFSFDDVEATDSTLYSDALAKNLIGITVESAFLPTLVDENCVYCSKKLFFVAKYELNCSFCSEKCWSECIRSSLTDLRSGGISSWPPDLFVSLCAKRKFIELASETLDGDFLLRIILLIKCRLDRDVFLSILLDNDLSFNSYLHFLQESGQTEEVSDLLLRRGHTVEAKISPFKAHIGGLGSTDDSKELEKMLQTLRIFAATELSSNPKLSILFDATSQAADLLQFQMKIASEWNSFLSTSKTLLSDDVRGLLSEISGTILGQNLANTIVACVLMDGNASKGSRAEHLKTRHKMSEEHFRWLVLEPLVAQKQWMAVESLLLEKKWMTRKAATTLPTDRLLLFLNSKKAPKTILKEYLHLLPDPETIIDMVVRLGHFDLGIEASGSSEKSLLFFIYLSLNYCFQYLVQKRNVVGLKTLRSLIPTKNINETKTIDAYLSLPTNQWKEYTSTA